MRCYGEKKPYQKKKIKSKDRYLFECERCEMKKNNVIIINYFKEACVLCKKTNGYMKKMDNHFIHVICALFCDFFEITDFWTMNLTPKFPLNTIIASLEDVKIY